MVVVRSGMGSVVGTTFPRTECGVLEEGENGGEQDDGNRARTSSRKGDLSQTNSGKKIKESNRDAFEDPGVPGGGKIGKSAVGRGMVEIQFLGRSSWGLDEGGMIMRSEGWDGGKKWQTQEGGVVCK